MGKVQKKNLRIKYDKILLWLTFNF
jgi:hypothetical protein